MADIKKRSEIEKSKTWAIEDIFATIEDWEKEFAALANDINVMGTFSGRLTESAQTLYDFFSTEEKLMIRIGNLRTYAMMYQDQDTGNSEASAMSERAMGLIVKANALVSFSEPQLLAAPDGLIEGFINEYEPLKEYKFEIEKILRMRAHTLDEAGEKLLAQAGEALATPRNVYTMLTNADLTFPEVSDGKGGKTKLSHSRFIPMLENPDRAVREEAYKAYYDTYRTIKNTTAASYAGLVKSRAFNAKVRGYESTLEASLYPLAIPLDVYTSLVDAMHDGVKYFNEYMDLRAKLLGVDKLRYYDLYVPLFEYDGMVTFEEARENIQKALAPLGEEYVRDSAHAFDDRWIDMCENQGKRSGAYCTGAYGVHPYILCSYQNTLDNMFTVSHELGHAMHTFYSSKNNGYFASHYSIFLAEVASTTNEMLMARYRIDNATCKEEKQYLLNHLLETMRTTMYRQTLFADFELRAHQAYANGTALTSDFLSNLYKQVNLEYYPTVEMDDYIPYEWSRIPHFYTAYYVYQYSTGIAAAVKFSSDIYNKVPGALEKYLGFLSAGGTKYPIDVLKDAGLDMTKPDTVRQALEFFKEILDELKATL